MNAAVLSRYFFFAWLWCWTAQACADVPVPYLQAHVTDLTGTLSYQQRNDLENTLRSYENRKGSQIAVLIVSSTASESIESYSRRVVERWRLGRRGVDDGVLLLVAKNDHTMRIEVGYGLTNALSNSVCQRIIDDYLTPAFRKGDFSGGLREGVNAILASASGEALPPPSAVRFGSSFRPHANANVWGFAAFAAFFVHGFIRTIFGSLLAGLIVGGVVGYAAWMFTGIWWIALLVVIGATLIAMFATSDSSSYGHNSCNYHRHRHHHHRSGGFSGGGGGFGGGGASGKW